MKSATAQLQTNVNAKIQNPTFACDRLEKQLHLLK